MFSKMSKFKALLLLLCAYRSSAIDYRPQNSIIPSKQIQFQKGIYPENCDMHGANNWTAITCQNEKIYYYMGNINKYTMRVFLTDPNTLFLKDYSNSTLQEQIEQSYSWGENSTQTFKYYIDNKRVSILNTTYVVPQSGKLHQVELYNWVYKGQNAGTGNFMQPIFEHENLIIQVKANYLWGQIGQASYADASEYTLLFSTNFEKEVNIQLKNVSNVHSFAFMKEENQLTVIYQRQDGHYSNFTELIIDLQKVEFTERLLDLYYSPDSELQFTKEYLIVNQMNSRDGFVNVYLRPSYRRIFQTYSNLIPVRVSPQQTYFFSSEDVFETFTTNYGETYYSVYGINEKREILKKFYSLSDGIVGIKWNYTQYQEVHYGIARLCSFREYLDSRTFQCYKCPEGQISILPFGEECYAQNPNFLDFSLNSYKFESFYDLSDKNNVLLTWLLSVLTPLCALTVTVYVMYVKKQERKIESQVGIACNDLQDREDQEVRQQAVIGKQNWLNHEAIQFGLPSEIGKGIRDTQSRSRVDHLSKKSLQYTFRGYKSGPRQASQSLISQFPRASPPSENALIKQKSKVPYIEEDIKIESLGPKQLPINTQLRQKQFLNLQQPEQKHHNQIQMIDIQQSDVANLDSVYKAKWATELYAVYYYTTQQMHKELAQYLMNLYLTHNPDSSMDANNWDSIASKFGATSRDDKLDEGKRWLYDQLYWVCLAQIEKASNN
ncbi:hypothetical protein FGO68_gene12904 [Halteria grandinella]|uniref:Transmembrane protein n=1 Tax=Halteria grandinella TaxID=5974 RepID=A0A8J8NVZ9_HALGN|nr:hypothetical protein FGO68_gene12904 [Halteria grandinella]